MRRLVTVMAVYLFSPFLATHFILSNFRSYRALFGGHWERWKVLNPAAGIYNDHYWMRVDACYHKTGEWPAWDCAGGRPVCCEHRGRNVTPPCNAECPGCGRNLLVIQDAPSSIDEDSGNYIFSCPCGEWSTWATEPAYDHAIIYRYLGSPEDQQCQNKQQWSKASA